MRGVIVLLVLLLASLGWAKGKTVGYDQIVVVTVGIEHYDGWADLPNAPKDVELFLDALDGPWDAPVQVVRLEEAQATKDGILQALDLAATEAGNRNNSLLVFYFAGHGTTEKNAGYLVPYGGKKGAYTTWLSMSELEGFAATRASAVPHQLYILGSCVSGTLLKTRMRGEDELRKQQLAAGWRQAELTRIARIGLTAGSDKQSIPDGKEGAGSRFGQAVANALRDIGRGRAADYDGDGCVDKFELATYVHGRGKTRHNTPRMGLLRGDDSGMLALCKGRFTAPPKVSVYADGRLRGIKPKPVGGPAPETAARGVQLIFAATAHRPALRHIPAGTFSMDETQHTVTLSEPFWMMQTEVTQAQYKAVAGQSPSYFGGCGADCPVERVSWWDAVAYANALSAKEGRSACYTLSGCEGTAGGGCADGESHCFDTSHHCASIEAVPTCTGYRLPTEAEWEYAARAGTSGAQHGPVKDVAWYKDNAGSKTHPVGGKAANAWGLRDMLGNVWEWCWDWKAAYPTSAQTDPAGPSSGDDRVIRGGSWINSASWARSASRNGGSPRDRFLNLGFRLVRRPRAR